MNSIVEINFENEQQRNFRDSKGSSILDQVVNQVVEQDKEISSDRSLEDFRKERL